MTQRILQSRLFDQRRNRVEIIRDDAETKACCLKRDGAAPCGRVKDDDLVRQTVSRHPCAIVRVW